jgi:hypothetical protein
MYVFIGVSSFSVHLKLHPGIRFSHSSSKTCFPPSCLESVSVSYDSCSIGILKYELSLASSDWRYPFDLCGSIYRLSDVITMLVTSNTKSTTPKDEDVRLLFSNPNNLEVFGNELFWRNDSFSSKYRYCLTSAHHLLSVVTVNRVQSTYQVPIFVHQSGEVDFLNKHLLKFLPSGEMISDQCLNYDLKKYRTSLFLSVHVGEIFLKSEEKKPAVERQCKSDIVERPIDIIRVC